MKLFNLIVALIISFLGLLLDGYVFSSLWAWFISPIFGLGLLSFGQAIGISVVISYATHSHAANMIYESQLEDASDEESFEAMVKLFFSSICYALIVFVSAFLLHCAVDMPNQPITLNQTRPVEASTAPK